MQKKGKFQLTTRLGCLLGFLSYAALAYADRMMPFPHKVDKSCEKGLLPNKKYRKPSAALLDLPLSNEFKNALADDSQTLVLLDEFIEAEIDVDDFLDIVDDFPPVFNKQQFYETLDGLSGGIVQALGNTAVNEVRLSKFRSWVRDYPDLIIPLLNYCLYLEARPYCSAGLGAF